MENFKELLDCLLRYSENDEQGTIKINTLKEFLIKRKELIKMYEDLKEQKEKPVIVCKSYEIVKYESCIWVDKIDKYGIKFKNSNFHQEILSKNIEEKDGILITDDFIFMKGRE